MEGAEVEEVTEESGKWIKNSYQDYLNKPYVQGITDRILECPHQYGALLLVEFTFFAPTREQPEENGGETFGKETIELLKQFTGGNGLYGLMHGNEFYVWMDPVASRKDALRLSEELLEAMKPAEKAYGAVCSVGAAWHLCKGADFIVFYYEADQALYEAKRSGGHKACLYAKNKKRRLAIQQEEKRIQGWLGTEGVIMDDVEDLMYLADPNSYEMVYMNQAAKMAKGYGPQKELEKNVTCYRFIYGRDKPCENCKVLPENSDRSQIVSEVSQNGGEKILTREKMVYYQGRELRMKVITNLNNHEFMVKRIRDLLEQEEAMYQAFMMTAYPEPAGMDCRRLLGIAGEFYRADCIFFFRHNPNKSVEVEEWHTIQGAYYAERWKEIETEIGNILKPLFIDDGLLVMDNINIIEKTYPEIYEFLLEAKIWSLYGRQVVRQDDPYLGQALLVNPKKHLGELKIFTMISYYMMNENSAD